MTDSIVDEIAKVIARHYDYEALHQAFPTEERFNNWIERLKIIYKEKPEKLIAPTNKEGETIILPTFNGGDAIIDTSDGFCFPSDEDGEEEFTEVILWHKVKSRPMTRDEKQEYAEIRIGDEEIEEIYVGIMPDDGQEVLIKTRWGVDSDVAINDNDYIGLECWGDWEDVEYWAEMPKGEQND